MEQNTSERNFGTLPEKLQQEIKNLLIHDKFAQAKELYEQWLNSLKDSECFS